jgi:hypothetical protein
MFKDEPPIKDSCFQFCLRENIGVILHYTAFGYMDAEIYDSVSELEEEIADAYDLVSFEFDIPPRDAWIRWDRTFMLARTTKPYPISSIEELGIQVKTHAEKLWLIFHADSGVFFDADYKELMKHKAGALTFSFNVLRTAS